MTKLLARIGRTALIAACFIFLGTSAAHAARWVSSNSSTPVPMGAVLAGAEENNINAGVNLYVCRVAFRGGIHPGKLIDSSWRRCNFGWGGDEWYSLKYEVLIANGEWLYTGPSIGALVGGHEADGAPLYICRATVTVDGINHGTASGKLIGNRGAEVCSIGYGGHEEYFSSYALFYAAKEDPPVMKPPQPETGDVQAEITIDVPSGSICGDGTFLLEGRPGTAHGQYIPHPGSPGLGYCVYRAYFGGLLPGTYRVQYPDYRACSSTNVTAHLLSVVTLSPYVYACH
jgi:hypothetical protein